MKQRLVLLSVAIAAIAMILVVAIIKGFDGALVVLGTNTIAGLAGLFIGRTTIKK